MESIKSNNKGTCWFDWEEWKNIYNKLYSTDEKEQSKAIKRLSAWRSRNKLPISVEVTGYFVELNLNRNNRSQNELELGLSMAISRMVNGFVDSTRDMLKLNKTNMFKKANEINLPTMFVDIRHESSHGKLPHLQLLKPISLTALDWLNDYYWKPQLIHLDSNFQKIRSFLNIYKIQSEEDNGFIRYIEESMELFNDISSDILGNMMIPILLDEDYLITNEFLPPTNSYAHIPSQLKKTYQPLLQFLHQKYPHFLIIILYLLIDRICKFKFLPPQSKKQKSTPIPIPSNDNQIIESKISLMTHWTLYFLQEFNITVKKQEGLVNYKIDLPYRHILEKCIENIHSKYCQKILNVAMKKNLDGSKRVYTTSTNKKKNKSTSATVTASDSTDLDLDSDEKIIDSDEKIIDSDEPQINYSVDQVLSNLNCNNNNVNNSNDIKNVSKKTTTTATATTSTKWKLQNQWISSPIGVLPPPNDQNSSSFDLLDDLDDNFDLGNFVEVSSIDHTTKDPSLYNNFNNNNQSLFSKIKTIYPNLNKNSIIRKEFVNEHKDVYENKNINESEIKNEIKNEKEKEKENENGNEKENENGNENKNEKNEDDDVIEIPQPILKKQKTSTTTSVSKKKQPQKGKTTKGKGNALDDFLFWK
ncbi:hypothetical protein ACTFIV_007454 [Dictyostelium citrinum]